MKASDQSSLISACGSVRRARGYALAVVLLLAVVVTMGVAVLMQRHSVTYLAMARQVKGYSAHHQSAGIREVFNRWLPLARGKLETSRGDDGLVFRLHMPKSGVINVYMADGQGTILTRTDSLSGRQREILEDAAWILNHPEGEMAARVPQDTSGLFRSAGPAQVSVRGADPVVIEAICMAVLADASAAKDAAEAIVRQLGVDEFGDGPGSKRGREAAGAAVNKALASAGVDPADAPKQPGTNIGGGIGRALQSLNLDPWDVRDIESVLTEKNTVWMVVAESEDNGKVFDRSGGLYEYHETRASDTLNQNAGFLTWERMEVGE